MTPFDKPAKLPRFGGAARRILAGMGALLVGQALNIFIQLVSVPSFLYVWDTANYGRWLLISAIPSYLSMLDGGLLGTCSNEITMLHARGDKSLANSVFQSALALVMFLFFGGALVAAVILGAVPEPWLSSDLRIATWLLVVQTLASLFGGPIDASYRSHGQFAYGAHVGNAVRAVEFAGMLLGLFLGGTFVSTAFAMLVVRVFGIGVQIVFCARRFPDLQWSVAKAHRSHLAALLRPAIGFMAFPIGNVLTLQSMTLIVGVAFGPTAVAIFNTYRTISRLAIQTTSVFSHALWAEFSILFGRGDIGALKSLYYKSERIGIAISVACSVLIFPVAPLFLHYWTNDKIMFAPDVFACFCFATLLGSMAHVPRGLLMSINQHMHLARIYLIFAAGGASISVALGNHMGLSGAVVASTIADCSLMVTAFWQTRIFFNKYAQMVTTNG
jgi:O-antigen/teichoic acid export membrane protein